MMMERMVEESNLKALSLPVPLPVPSHEKKSFKSLVSSKVYLVPLVMVFLDYSIIGIEN